MKIKKTKLRGWVKYTLTFILGAVLGIAVYQLFTIETIHTTPVGNYTCRGGIIPICTGSKEVADYLGV